MSKAQQNEWAVQVKNWNRPAFARCRCGHWLTEHDRATGKCPVPNARSYFRFYDLVYELPAPRPQEKP